MLFMSTETWTFRPQLTSRNIEDNSKENVDISTQPTTKEHFQR